MEHRSPSPGRRDWVRDIAAESRRLSTAIRWVRGVGALHATLAALCAAAAPDLSLEEAVERALAANRGLAAAHYAREGERLSVTAALSDFDFKIVPTSVLGRISGNNLFPGDSGQNASVGAQLRKKLDWGTELSVGPSWNRYGGSSNTTLNVSIRQPLLGGFGREVAFDAVHRAEHVLAGSERAYRQARKSLALETVEAYQSALRERSMVETSAALAERLRRHAIIASRKEKAGLAGPSDTLRARIRLKDAEDAFHRSGTFLELALGRLRHLLALPAGTELTLRRDPSPSLPVGDLETIAIASSGEVQQLRDDLAEAHRAARVAGNAALPDVSLGVSYGQAALADALLRSFIPTTQRQWSLFLQASGDLARTAEKMNHRRALLRAEAVAVALEDKAEDIRRQVRQQAAAMEAARARIALRREQIRQAEDKLALAEVKFAHDRADNFELIEAESDLHRARTELSAADTEHAIGAYTLLAMVDRFPP
jgi:outer membrane protein TolC